MFMINFGTIGTSWITDEFIQTAKKNEKFKINAIYSRDLEKARLFAEKHGAEKYFDDLEEMAETSGINAVYIASPNSFHCRQAKFFLQKGIHVICEKPIASNSAELNEMAVAAKENGVVLMEAFKSILTPNFDIIEKNIGKIGTIRTVYINFSKYSSRYDAYKDGKNVNTFNIDFSNGALMDLGVYCVYPVIRLFGMPQKINAQATFLESGVDCQGNVLFKYDTFNAVISYSKVSTSHIESEIQGENGTILIDNISVPEKAVIKYRNGTEEDISVPQEKAHMIYEINEFINCVLYKKEPTKNTLELSVNVMQCMDKIRNEIGLVYSADNLKIID